MPAKSATPRYAVGDVVAYRDRQNRPQTGEVRSIRADWSYYSKDGPLIVYDLYHPTYRDNRFHVSEQKLVGEDA